MITVVVARTASFECRYRIVYMPLLSPVVTNDSVPLHRGVAHVDLELHTYSHAIWPISLPWDTDIQSPVVHCPVGRENTTVIGCPGVIADAFALKSPMSGMVVVVVVVGQSGSVQPQPELQVVPSL